MPTIFISYCRTDDPSVQSLTAALRADGIHVWRDVDNLYGGEHWPRVIGEAVAAADLVLLVWSQHAAASHFVGQEWNIAVAQRKAILPCLLDATPLPPALSATNAIAANPLPPSLERICRAVHRLSSGMPDSQAPITPGVVLAQERWLQGMVFTPGEHDEKLPAVGVTVTAQEFGNTVTTTSEGRFRLTLPSAFQAGDAVTLQVEKPGWRIQLPPAGKTRLPADLRKEVVEVLLLPVDSKLFWTHARLVLFINDLSEKSTQQLTLDNKPVDFSRAIKDWAVKYGFSAEQAKAEIDRWIAEVQATHDDTFTLGLAAFAEKNFRKASALFHDAATQDERKLAELKQAEDTLVDNIVRAFRREGDAHANSYLFDEALTAYEQALRHVPKAQQPRLWAAVLHDIAGAHYERGLRTAGPVIHTHLAEAAGAYRQALEVYTRTDLPQDWAATHNNLGNALRAQGERTAGERGTQLLAEAVAAYRQALEVRTRPDLPQQWAETHNNLGSALQAQGERTAGEHGTQLLSEAAGAYRQALEVRTRPDLPQDWAMTHNNLGIALQTQGERAAGERGTQLLAEAVAAYRLVLEVYTRADLPQDWATTHNNLGNALQAQGERTAGERGTQLLAEAVGAYRQALEVYSRADTSYQWAVVQNNLAKAYVALQDWPQAVTSSMNVLDVYPDVEEAYRTASVLSHNVLFDFAQAFVLNQQWLERHPDDLAARSDFVEKHLTTGRFAESTERLAAILGHQDIEPAVQVALRALDIVNLLALHQAAAVPDRLDVMLHTITAQADDFQVTWSFGGTRHFIEQHATLVPCLN